MLDRLQRNARERFPRAFGFYDRHHATITGLVIIGFVGFVVFLGVKQYTLNSEQSQTKRDVNVVKRTVTILQQASPCRPNAKGEPTELKKCRRNFSQAVKTMTAVQACRILVKGARLIRIDGHVIGNITCVFPGTGTPIGTGRNGQGDRSANPTTSADGTGGEDTHEVAPGGGGSGGGGNGGVHQTPEPAPTPEPTPEQPAPAPEAEEPGKGKGPPDNPGNPGGGGGGGKGGGGEGDGGGGSSSGGSIIEAEVEVLPEAPVPVKPPPVCVPPLVTVNCSR